MPETPRPARESFDGVGPVGQHQRVLATEVAAIASASAPPVGGGIDHGIPASLAFVGLTKVTDPGHHVGGAQPIAGGTGRVVLDVQHTRQGNTIVGPATAVG